MKRKKEYDSKKERKRKINTFLRKKRRKKYRSEYDAREEKSVK